MKDWSAEIGNYPIRPEVEDLWEGDARILDFCNILCHRLWDPSWTLALVQSCTRPLRGYNYLEPSRVYDIFQKCQSSCDPNLFLFSVANSARFEPTSVSPGYRRIYFLHIWLFILELGLKNGNHIGLKILLFLTSNQNLRKVIFSLLLSDPIDYSNLSGCFVCSDSRSVFSFFFNPFPPLWSCSKIEPL